ncbi:MULTISPECIES: IclR family transcriptional regulator C-terminal domain-containing protein [unclassified Streptomyces]|uniref:IclR family transcriptional regulator domain-containing protein n=1 Tax=unclassified Streptomyces TaxID=2593676 RepID=UPI0037F14B97
MRGRGRPTAPACASPKSTAHQSHSTTTPLSPTSLPTGQPDPLRPAYVDGDIQVSHEAAQPGIPTVYQHVDFRESAHASALGKANLAQLSRDARLDHLSRYQPMKLTGHTLTNPDALFRAFDLSPLQYDFNEYSDREVCAASPLILPGPPSCIAVAVPATERRRLNQATAAIRNHSTAMALSLRFALDPSPRFPHQAHRCETPAYSA